jgi:hypothetical protein
VISGDYFVEKGTGSEETGEFKATQAEILNDTSQLDSAHLMQIFNELSHRPSALNTEIGDIQESSISDSGQVWDNLGKKSGGLIRKRH